MAYLNADIPPIYCKIRKEYLYDLKKHQGESVDCCIFSVVSITDRALLFNIMLPNGACFWRLPISAFFQEKFDRAEVPDMPIDQLQLWNCFSYYPSVHCFSFLRGKRGKYYGKDKKNYPFEYLFTIDWGHPEGNILDTEHSEIPAEHKCAHILALDDGNYAAQPNNRILWDAPNYTVGDGVPDYSVQTTKWNVENKDWLTEDSDKMFYDVEEKVNAEDKSYE
jgi:hypothetical protein